MRRPSLIFALLVCSAPALANTEIEVREGYEPITEQAFRKLPADTPAGKKFTVHYVRFIKLFREELKVDGGKFPDGRPVRSFLSGRLVVENKPNRRALRERLEANKDSDGQQLIPKKSNVQLFGVGRQTPRGYVLSVNRVHLLDSHLERFRRDYESLPPGDAQARLDLARTIKRALRYWPEDWKKVEPIVDTLMKEARDAERAKLEPLPGGVTSWIQFAKRHEEIPVLAEAWAHPKISAGDRERIAEVLREDLHARFYLGKWYARDELQRKLGFGQDASGAWLPGYRLELLEAGAAEKKRRKKIFLKPALNRQLLEVAMKKGDVIEGMDKDMVLAAKRSYPTQVDRVREKHDKGKLSWELWVMEDGMRIYFLNGHVFKKKAPAQGAGS